MSPSDAHAVAPPLAASSPELCFRDVSYAYDGVNGIVEACSDLRFTVSAGESVMLIGPSGCGKSTTLLMAAGLQQPSQGEVLLDGAPLTAPRARTSFIPQDLGLFPWKTVIQNAELQLRLRRIDASQARERAMDALETVGLVGFENAYPKELSGGMRQRLALARGLASDADLLLMDEPLSAIDALQREALQDILLQLWRERGYAQMMVTHSIEEAVFLGTRILVFSKRPGHIIAEIQNEGMGGEGWRDSDEFAARCREVRRSLEANASEDVRSDGIRNGDVRSGDGL